MVRPGPSTDDGDSASMAPSSTLSQTMSQTGMSAAMSVTGSETDRGSYMSSNDGENGAEPGFKFRTMDICDEAVITQLGGRGKIGEQVRPSGN